MTTQSTNSPGLRYYTGDEEEAFRLVRKIIERAFQHYAYSPVELPILGSASLFLDQSGEGARKRLYVFADPGGSEICLRPDLTIPACQLFLQEYKGLNREVRLSHVGPVFRFEPPAAGHYRQFHQAGVSLFGAVNRELADAEILSLALDAVEQCGASDTTVAVGDTDIVGSFIEGLSIPARWKTRLLRIAWNEKALAELINSLAQDSARDGQNEGANSNALLPLIASIGPENAQSVIKEVLALADIRHIGGRTSDEIAERLVSNINVTKNEPLSAELVQGLSALLAVRGAPEKALRDIERHAAAFGIASLGSTLERCARRWELITAYRGELSNVIFDAGLKRRSSYYAGFVFDIYGASSAGPVSLCGGGRYDRLLESLGSAHPVPAVGCSIGVDRLLLARPTVEPSKKDETIRPTALVVAAGNVLDAQCIRIGTALRRGGWNVEMDASARRPRAALANALKRGTRYLVVAGEQEITEGLVRVKRLQDRLERLVPLADLTAFAKAESLPAGDGKQEQTND